MSVTIRTAVTLLILVSATACASSGARPSPFPQPGRPAAEPVPVPVRPIPSAGLPALVVTALELQGSPYRNGGADPSGFDCSGLVAYVFSSYGRTVPRTTMQQFEAGQPVDAGSLEPGDLVFFTTIAPGPSHVGIFVSGGDFVHAPSSSGVVRVESLAAPYWSSRYIGARRLR